MSDEAVTENERVRALTETAPERWNPYLPLEAARRYGGSRAVFGVMWSRLSRKQRRPWRGHR